MTWRDRWTLRPSPPAPSPHEYMGRRGEKECCAGRDGRGDMEARALRCESWERKGESIKGPTGEGCYRSSDDIARSMDASPSPCPSPMIHGRGREGVFARGVMGEEIWKRGAFALQENGSWWSRLRGTTARRRGICPTNDWSHSPGFHSTFARRVRNHQGRIAINWNDGIAIRCLANVLLFDLMLELSSGCAD